MNVLKKLGFTLFLFVFVIALTGCQKNDTVGGSLEDLMSKVYKDIPEDERPMMLSDIVLTDENEEYYLGTSEINYEEALASEPAISSVAHSVVLIRMKENSDIETAITLIKEKVDPRKWICVEAEEVVVEDNGNLIILIMATKGESEKIQKSFKNL